MKNGEHSSETREAVDPLLPVIAAAAAGGVAVLYLVANVGRGAHIDALLAYLWNNGGMFLGQVTATGLLKPVVYLGLGAAYFLSLYLAGREVCLCAGIRCGPPAVDALCRLGVGAGTYSLLILGLGLCGLLYREALIGAFAAPYVFAAGRLVLQRKSSPGEKDRNVPDDNKSFAFPAAVLILFLLFAAFGLITCLTPPTAADALMYHLAIPRLYLDAHKIYYIPFMLHANWPQGVEMHYLAGLSFKDAVLAGTINFGFLIMAALAVAALTRRFSTSAAALAAGTLFLSIPIASSHFYFVNVEPALAFFELLALWFYLEWKDTDDSKMLAACGLFCGFAMAVKLTGGVFFILVFLCVAARMVFQRNGGRNRFLKILVFCALALAPVLPWLLKSYLWTGNPVWPFLYSVFGGKNWSALNARDYGFYLRHFFGEPGWKNFVLCVPDLLHRPWAENPGLAPAALIPFFLLVRKGEHGKKAAGFLLAMAAALFVFWFWTSPQPRFLLPALGMGCAGFGLLLSNTGHAARAVFLAAVCLHCALFATLSLQHIPNALGGWNRQAFLSRDDSVHLQVHHEIDRTLPQDAKILLLWDSRGFNCPRPYLWGDPLGQNYLNYREFATPAALLQRLHREGVTHVLFHRNGLATKEKFDRMLRAGLGLGPSDATVVYSAIPFQSILIRSGIWQRIYTSPGEHYYLFEIRYPDAIIKRDGRHDG